jgi:hypothetical protein
MAEWTFRDYQRRTMDSDDKPVLVNEILQWTRGLPAKAQAKIDMIILTLQGRAVWPPQYVSDCGFKDIWELRVKSGNVQYRPLGFYGPQRKVFTLVIGTIEKVGKIPAGDGHSAIERRARVLEGWPTCEHEFAEEAEE